jgi:hypothetical protein
MIIKQLSLIIEIKIQVPENLHTMNNEQIGNVFFEILSNIDSGKNIVIILDSIDQLKKEDYSLEWLIYNLPKRLRMIYSVLSDEQNSKNSILKKLKKRVNPINFLNVGFLEQNEANLIFENYFMNSNRKISQEQIREISLCLNNNPSSLHVKLLFDISFKWTTEDKLDETIINYLDSLYKDKTSGLGDARKTICYLIKNLENLRGKELVSRCLFYLTIFEFSGISEREIKDILSIDDDDDFLNSVYKYHKPPIRQFQNALWLRICFDLKDYLVRKEIDEITVISWLIIT